MKQIFLTFLLLFSAQIAFAQLTEEKPVYYAIPSIKTTLVLNIRNKEVAEERLTFYLKTFFEKITSIRKDEVTKKLTVIHITAFTEKEMREALKHYGFVDTDVISYE